ncbi:MAG: Uma2 family endonuclease [Planctomycetota bacterium]|nr:Uma2 family endonuclease [Planctomycetota bacterium]
MAPKVMVTCEEFEALSLAEKISPRAELIDGEIVEHMGGGYTHSFVTGSICVILGNFVNAHKLGRVLTGETGMHIRWELPRCRLADVSYLSYQRAPKGAVPSGFLRVPPELIVEVLSEDDTWTDIEEKIKDYHNTGVDMVWVADPQTRTVRVFPRGGMPSVVHDGSEIDGGAILPGFRIPIARFFDEE